MDYNVNLAKGCVYFFKHSGIDGVKIGYSSSPSPIKRFEQFKTYAPYGAEMIGFILTENAPELEFKLHKKYKSKRLNGEWFDISIEECDKEIKFYSDQNFNKARSDFYTLFATDLDNLAEEIRITGRKIRRINNPRSSPEEKFIDLYRNMNVKDPKQLSKTLGISIQMVYRYIKRQNLE